METGRVVGEALLGILGVALAITGLKEK